MRYLPQTEDDVRAMLERIGVKSIDELFRGVPDAIKVQGLLDLPPALTEPELRREMLRLAGPTPGPTFLGAGAYPHPVPAAVEQLLLRGELYTAYTPYQPEVAQGTLQSMFEFQTMVAEILGLDVANASLYDGSTATAEAVLMALRLQPKRTKVVLAKTVHPEYREVVKTFATAATETVVEIDFDPATGALDFDALAREAEGAAVIVTQTPNFFGVVADQRRIADIAHSAGALLVVAVPEVMSLGLFESPGAQGADIATGEGLGYGVGVQVGGPACGLFACREKFLRQMPGRLVGETVDSEGHRAYCLTLSTREQHIRREKATSNICTNQGLLALAFAMHLALLGKTGFVRAARQNLARALRVKERFGELGLVPRFEGPHFNEVAYRVPGGDADALQAACLELDDVTPGLPLGRLYGEDFADTLLVCTTEMHSPEDIERLIQAVAKAVS